MLKRILVVILLVFLGFITFLLWPLKSKEFKISWDEDAIKDKRKFLDSVRDIPPADSLPNIVLILVDDLGLYDMSFYGGKNVETPYMDGIARAGVAFDQAYVAAPMCSASRAALLTGRYPQRFGFEFQMHDRYLKNRLEYFGFKYLRPVKKTPDIERS